LVSQVWYALAAIAKLLPRRCPQGSPHPRGHVQAIQLGRDPGQLRLPMTPLDADGEEKLRKSLANYGLL
jgi:hypothetical protein